MFSVQGRSWFFIVLLVSFSQLAQADGYSWLDAQQQTDGEFHTDQALATPYQASAEVLTLNSQNNTLE